MGKTLGKIFLISLLFIGVLHKTSWALKLRDNSCAGYLRPPLVALAGYTRPISEVTHLGLMTLNFNAIYEYRKPEKRIWGNQGYSYVVDESQEPRLKPYAHTLRLAQLINTHRPDIVLGIEIESNEAAQRFAREELNGQYIAIFFSGLRENTPRMAYFIRVDLPFIAEFQSHRDRKAFYATTREQVAIFPRDVPQLNLYRENEKKPFFIFFGMHAKAQRSSAQNADRNSYVFRTTQFIALADLLQTQVFKDAPNANVILMGDFNTDVANSREIIPISRILTSSVNNFANIPENNRYTHTYIDRLGRVQYLQLDDIFVSRHLLRRITQTKILDLVDENGVPYPKVSTRAERDDLPTDHRSVFMLIQIP